MSITRMEQVDIYLDKNGQPVPTETGDVMLVEKEACGMQDIRLEAMTEEGELFFEEEDGEESYGFGMLDFIKTEYDEFKEMEIQQRIKEKLSKREYIDSKSITTSVVFNGHQYDTRVRFCNNDSKQEYNLDISNNGVMVIAE